MQHRKEKEEQQGNVINHNLAGFYPPGLKEGYDRSTPMSGGKSGTVDHIWEWLGVVPGP